MNPLNGIFEPEAATFLFGVAILPFVIRSFVMSLARGLGTRRQLFSADGLACLAACVLLLDAAGGLDRLDARSLARLATAPADFHRISGIAERGLRDVARTLSSLRIP